MRPKLTRLWTGDLLASASLPAGSSALVLDSSVAAAGVVVWPRRCDLLPHHSARDLSQPALTPGLRFAAFSRVAVSYTYDGRSGPLQTSPSAGATRQAGIFLLEVGSWEGNSIA
jgi:hypothetical protein